MQQPMRSAKPARPAGGGGSGKFRKPFQKKRVCRFCIDKVEYIDFKNVNLLRNFISERGKILPRRITSVSAKKQRELSSAIKRARAIALLPFIAE